MQGSINFDGSLVGNITGGGGGGGDTVVITPVVTSGTKIADVSVNGVEKDLYCPTPPTPPEIDITPVVTSGTKIADVSLNGVEKDLYVPNPTTVNVTQVQQSGTKIATIGVNGVNTDIYAPEGGESSPNYSTTEHVVCKWIDGRTDVYERIVELSNINYTAGSINVIDNTINTNNVSHFMVIFATYIDDEFNHRSVSIAGGPVELYLSGAGLCVRNNSQIRIRGLYACIRCIKL